jgi:hypothetical protein
MNVQDQEKTKRFLGIMREVGICPHKAKSNEMVIEVARSWSDGTLNDVQLMRSFRNLTILNPKLRVDNA